MMGTEAASASRRRSRELAASFAFVTVAAVFLAVYQLAPGRHLSAALQAGAAAAFLIALLLLPAPTWSASRPKLAPGIAVLGLVVGLSGWFAGWTHLGATLLTSGVALVLGAVPLAPTLLQRLLIFGTALAGIVLFGPLVNAALAVLHALNVVF